MRKPLSKKKWTRKVIEWTRILWIVWIIDDIRQNLIQIFFQLFRVCLPVRELGDSAFKWRMYNDHYQWIRMKSKSSLSLCVTAIASHSFRLIRAFEWRNITNGTCWTGNLCITLHWNNVWEKKNRSKHWYVVSECS